MANYNQRLIIFFILILNMPAALCVDEHAPSLPAMTQFFGTTPSAMQLTISFYMLGMAISQWIAGVLSDRFGRRPILFSNAFIFLIASFVCIFTNSASTLLIGRFFQGVGTGCFAMISPALMGDALEKKRFHRVSAYFSMCYSLIPILAPVIGGYIQDWMGWRGNFGFMFLFTLIIACIAFFKLPETHRPTEEHRLFLSKILRNNFIVLSTPAYILPVIGMIILWSMIIVFSVMAPFILQNTLKLSATEYGYCALIVGLGILVGNYLNTQLHKIFNPEQILQIGVTAMLLVSLIQLSFVLFMPLHILTLMAPILLLMIANGIIFPSYYAIAASVFTNLVGIASSLIGCLILAGAVICTVIMTQLEAHSALTLSAVYVALSVLCFFTNLARKVI
jgi:Bcr/CflA subfamily drug resistance transporter